VMMDPEVLGVVLHRSESPPVLVTVPYVVPPGGVVGVGVGIDGFVLSSRNGWRTSPVPSHPRPDREPPGARRRVRR
jgi:hypothetical protein